MKVLYLIFITFIPMCEMRAKLHYYMLLSLVYLLSTIMMWFSKEKKNDRKKTLNMIFFYESQRCKKKTPKNKPISLVDIFLAQKYMSKMLHSGKFERRMQDLCFKSDIGFWQTFACSSAEFPYSLQAVTCMYSHKRINLTKKGLLTCC